MSRHDDIPELRTSHGLQSHSVLVGIFGGNELGQSPVNLIVRELLLVVGWNAVLKPEELMM